MKNLLGAQPYTTDDLVGRPSAVIEWTIENTRKGDSVVHIGCGFGWLEAEVLASGHDVRFLSLEPSESDLRAIRTLMTDDRVRTLVASGTDLPIPSQSIECCVMSEVLEHVPPGSERQVMSEIARVLRVGGRCLITVPLGSTVSRVTDPAWLPLKHRHYSSADLAALCAGLPLKISKSQGRGGLVTLVSIYDMYVSKWLFRRSPRLARRLEPWITREWGHEARPGFVHLWAELERIT